MEKMELEVEPSCPICGLRDMESLSDHLQTHSKKSLIDSIMNLQSSSSSVIIKPDVNFSSQCVEEIQLYDTADVEGEETDPLSEPFTISRPPLPTSVIPLNSIMKYMEQPGTSNDGWGESAAAELMTDEELPPQGEISEYEESNSCDIYDGTPAFPCYECLTPFSSLISLLNHRQDAHRETKPIPASTVTAPTGENQEIEWEEEGTCKKQFICIYCSFVTLSKLDLKSHSTLEHPNEPEQPKEFVCPTCGKEFPARVNLRKHFMVHNEKRHICQTCKKAFPTRFKLKEHSRVHTGVTPYVCNVCNKSYRTQSVLSYHIKSVHTKSSEPPTKKSRQFYCRLCHGAFTTRTALESHMELHSRKPKKCVYCTEAFVRSSALLRHIRAVHDPTYESLAGKDCHICGKTLHPNSFKAHLRVHIDEKPFKCPVCNKFFRTAANLSIHSWTHTNEERPFKCKYCTKSYIFKKDLENHSLSHKRKTMHYVCNECGVKFTYKVNLKRHMEEHYGEKRFACLICGKAFHRNYYLIEHQRIHTGVKPFTCTICGKASTTKSNHRTHLKIHDSRDPGSLEG